MQRPVELRHASRLVNHGPTALVTSAHGGHRNVMAAAWSMPVEFTPPRLAVVIDKSTWTRALVLAGGAFGLCLPGRALADLTYTVGSSTGRDAAPGRDKYARHGIATFDDPVLGLPMVQDCVAWLACRLIPEPHAQAAYDTCFGEVLWAAADDRVFADGRWSMRNDNRDLHTLHHLGAGLFASPMQTLQARPLAG